MRSRWKQLGQLEADREYVVLASSIPPRSLRSTGRLFRGSRAVRRQLLTTDGLLGFSMLAEPMRKRYATLSVWSDGAALDAFARGEPHRRLMEDLAPEMGASRFERWVIDGSNGAPTWEEALHRLG